MSRRFQRFHFSRFQIAVHLGALAPLVLLAWDLWQGQLSVNPIQDITFRTGKTAMALLVLTLTATPMNTMFGFKSGLKVRRALGVYAFAYALLHFLTYAWLDYSWDLTLIGLEIYEKPYVLVGFAAFLILIPLAVTSTKGWQRRLKKSWKTLHKWVYVAGVLVMLHYIWVQKADIREPLLWTGGLILLLLLRLPQVRRQIIAHRNRSRTMRSLSPPAHPSKIKGKIASSSKTSTPS